MSIKDKIALFKKELEGNFNLRVKIILNSGRVEIGIPETLNDNYIVLKTDNGNVTLFDFEGWEILKTNHSRREDKKILNETLNKIIMQFNEKKLNKNLMLKKPNFNFPTSLKDLKIAEKEKVKKIWDKINSRYHHLKITKNTMLLSSLMDQYIELSQKYPNISQIYYNIGCILYQTTEKSFEEALNNFERAFGLEKEENYAFNIAAVSIELNLDKKAHEMLTFYFCKKKPSEDIDAWFLFCHLTNHLKFFDSYNSILKTILKSKENHYDINLVFNSILYFLHFNDFNSQIDDGLNFLTNEYISDDLLTYIIKTLNFLIENLKKKQLEPFKRPLSSIIEQNIKRYEKGFIISYKQNKGFGFLRKNDTTYFFHHSAILDSVLLRKLYSGTINKRNKIPVFFEKTVGKKGFAAINISLYRPIHKSFNLAIQFSEEGKFSQALNLMKIVLDENPNYPDAINFYEKWRAYSRYKSIPEGSNPFARAKRAEILDEDFEEAEKLYRTAINTNDNVESAIRDLISLLERLEKFDKAIDIIKLNTDKIKSRNFYEQKLISLYQKTEQFELLVDILYKKLERTEKKFLKVRILKQMGVVYLQKRNFDDALEIYKEVLFLDKENIDAQKKLAICLINLKKFDDAEILLKKITEIALDNETIKILEALGEAKKSGKFLRDDLLAIEDKLTDFSGEISKFAQHYIEKCDYSGVTPEYISIDDKGIKKFIGTQKNAKNEIYKLKEIAKSFGTKNPQERSKNYLSAAKIAFETSDNPYQLFKYLGRSFASKGDSIILQNGHLDAARTWFSEALALFDHIKIYEKYEWDMENALSMFIYSILGQSRIPKPSTTIPPLSATLYEVLNKYPKKEKVFEYISYLNILSRLAGSIIIRTINETEKLKLLTIDFLKSTLSIERDNFSEPFDLTISWNKIHHQTYQKLHELSSEFQTLIHFELSSMWVENAIEKLKKISDSLLFDLDKQYLLKLQTLLNILLEIIKQESFEDREYSLLQIIDRSSEIMNDIELNPTKFSIESIYPFVIIFNNIIKKELNSLYETAFPQISIRLPDKFDTYIPNENHEIIIQIVVKNKLGRSPAESLELIIQEDAHFFTQLKDAHNIKGSLRGGQQKILEIPIKVTKESIESKTFSLTVYAQYRSKSEELTQTEINNFSIKLYSTYDFEEIDNPYAPYAEGGIVDDPKMFYGRRDLLDTIIASLIKAKTQSKSLIIYGQKRSGKSSILYHLKLRLEKYEDILIIDLGNIASILDDGSKYSMIHQILWSILDALENSIKNHIEKGFPRLKLKFPSISEFFNHPSPLQFFNTIFKKYKKIASVTHKWQNNRTILLIDEFSYLYGLILEKKLSKLFMKNWKAILQSNFFNAVLAGQDIMPKFKNMFPNEFGTTQDEKVSYLKKDEAILLIDQPIKIGSFNGESRYREKAIDMIYNLTAGSPFYIQLFCNRLIDYMNRKHSKYITDADIERIKNELIGGVTALGLDKFDNLIDSGDISDRAILSDDILKVLKLIAINSKTGPCNRNIIICETSVPIERILEDLHSREVISCEEGRYYQIRVGLFKEWILVNL